MSGFAVSSDPRRLDRDMIHQYLAQTSHWARGMTRTALERAIDHSLIFGVYAGSQQIGFARVVTDHATVAYLSDVFVLATWRGKGAGRLLLEAIMAHPDLQELRRFLLVSRDARPFYAKAGFTPIGHAERYMEWARSPALAVGEAA
ncbi:GNAT family N-acetyltransferase [Paludibacterium paludis]|uniref:N-acetyltransferase n=1 Tax=Paludibacterium paludis TaxID=1225769 RepID=A0A918P362_9NEIS|nr:GNAT family N-acetyltransferase [Paludibacterium paludis]GGY15986.1 N-acetyltransferase [Paludibacterium paludis]